MLELTQGLGPGQAVSQQTAESNARQRAVEMVGRFRTAEQNSTTADLQRDVRLGRRSWDVASQSWVLEWGVTPYNMAEVTVRRTDAANAPIPLTFAKILGHDKFNKETKSASSIAPAVGFKLPPGSSGRLDILPIAMDLGTWNDLLDQIYRDSSQASSPRHFCHTFRIRTLHPRMMREECPFLFQSPHQTALP